MCVCIRETCTEMLDKQYLINLKLLDLKVRKSGVKFRTYSMYELCNQLNNNLEWL